MANKGRKRTLYLAVVVGLGLVLRLISIKQSLWLDEATTALVSQRSILDYFTNFALGDFHPPVYYLLSILVTNILLDYFSLLLVFTYIILRKLECIRSLHCLRQCPFITLCETNGKFLDCPLPL